MRELIVNAVKIAVDCSITVYDTLFVALAEKLKAKLATTDKELYERLKGKELEGLVELVI